MKKDYKKYEKLVDDICSDETGADKPYSMHLKKWAIEIALMVNKEKQELLDKIKKS
jgi:hypothetical protein